MRSVNDVSFTITALKNRIFDGFGFIALLAFSSNYIAQAFGKEKLIYALKVVTLALLPDFNNPSLSDLLSKHNLSYPLVFLFRSRSCA